MRRRPPAASHVFIHAGALAQRHDGDPHEALPSLTAWQEAIDSDEQMKRAEALLDASQAADAEEEEVRFATDLPRDVVAEGFVSLTGDAIRPEAIHSLALSTQHVRRPRG